MNSTCVSIDLFRGYSRYSTSHRCLVIPMRTIRMTDNTNEKLKNRLCVVDGNSKLLISTLDIVYAQAHGNYCTLYLSNGKKYVLSKTLKKLSELIPEQYFLRSHQSFIINKNNVVQLTANSMLKISINNETELIPVSRRRKKVVQQWLQNNN